MTKQLHLGLSQTTLTVVMSTALFWEEPYGWVWTVFDDDKQLFDRLFVCAHTIKNALAKIRTALTTNEASKLNRTPILDVPIDLNDVGGVMVIRGRRCPVQRLSMPCR